MSLNLNKKVDPAKLREAYNAAWTEAHNELRLRAPDLAPVIEKAFAASDLEVLTRFGHTRVFENINVACYQPGLRYVFFSVPLTRLVVAPSQYSMAALEPDWENDPTISAEARAHHASRAHTRVPQEFNDFFIEGLKFRADYEAEGKIVDQAKGKLWGEVLPYLPVTKGKLL